MSLYKAAVLTISDTAACPGQADLDKTGPDISASLLGISPRLFSNIRTEIAPDDVASIRSMVRSWADDDDGVDVIICTGGTGWGERDVTVEALTPLLDKQLPSLSQALTAYGLSKTPFAALSNPLCGLISSKKRTLVVALPGSKGGVKDGMNVLIPLLQHMLSLLGNSSSAKQAVEELHGPRTAEPIVSCTDDGPAISSQAVTADTTAHDLTQHSHQHHHHHHHHHRQGHVHPRPNQPVSSRQRRSPHVLTPLADAVEIINRVIGSSGLGTEKRHLNPKIAGHVLAESISAPHPLPLWHSTNVDGYAFHSEDGPGDYPVRPKDSARPLERGQIERVTTGGPVPTGADCIVMVEDTELISASPSGEELFVRVLAPAAKKGENLRLPGSDLQEGEVIMQANELIGLSGGEIGLIGSVGRKEVLVHRKPRVALLSTGSELVNLSSPDSGSAAAPTASDTEPPPLPPRPSRATIEPLSSGPPAAARPAGGWTGIYDSNRPALQAVIESMGWEVIDLGIVKDETGAHEAAMRRGLEVADVVITTGGTSMGEGDLVKPLLEHSFGATIHFGRVAMAPGKPTTFATVPASDGGRDKVFFALPGNPASALVTFFVFVVPALRGLGGWAEKSRGLRPVWVEMTHALPLGGRPTYHRCTLEFSHSGLPLATSTGGQRSSRVGSLKGAEILVLVPASNAGEESRHVEKGARLEGLLLPGGWSG